VRAFEVPVEKIRVFEEPEPTLGYDPELPREAQMLTDMAWFPLEAQARVVGVSEFTLDRKADHFDSAGMTNLFATDEPSPDGQHLLPADIGYCILALKAEYPAFHPHEIAEICRRDACRVSHKTVQRVLDT
jgi:hypothetical protein